MLTLKLAWRSLWRNRRRTLITMSSIGLGLAVVFWTETMVSGSHNTMIDAATRMLAGHVTVQRLDYGKSPGADLFVPSVTSVIETGSRLGGVARSKVLLLARGVASSSNGSVAVQLIGSEPEAEKADSILARGIVRGRYLQSDDDHGIFLGQELARRLQLDVGRKLVVTTTDSRGELATELLRVVGIFRTGAEPLDTGLVQLTLSASRRILRMGPDEATQVGFLLANPDDQESFLRALERSLDDASLEVLPWEEAMPELANWVHLFEVLSHGMVWLMLLLVSFNILNTVLMSVVERTREFATLLALGVPPRMLRTQILLETALLGLLGTIGGAVLGTALSWWGSRNGTNLALFLTENFAIAGFPLDMMVYNRIVPRVLVQLATIVFVGTVAIGIYPMLRSTRVKVADSLRAH